MSRPLAIAKLTMWSLAIPLKHSFRHATAVRGVSEPLIVALELADGTIGYGETHPRSYVTGETIDDTRKTLRDVFLPLLVDARPPHFGEVIELAASLPCTNDEGRVITAARAAVEIALLDAYGQAFGRGLESVAGWLDETWLGPPGSLATARFGGVVSAESPAHVAASLRKMRLIRLPHFKLKVGDADDAARVDAAVRALRRGLRNGNVTLRLDANMAWSLDVARERLTAWESLPITCVEQPLARNRWEEWGELASATNLPLMADESVVTLEDAEQIVAYRAASWLNLRLSKNGGLMPTLRLALLARHHNLTCVVGCMVGETSILSAAQRRLLQILPGIDYAEGNFGRLLLADDVVRKPLRFGWAGRWGRLDGPGLGITVETSKLDEYSQGPPERIPFG
jgi:L-alanine-DL-glutamate epimerase-like enolase superfamily enzyme